MTEPKKPRDVGWAVAPGVTRPIREVIEEQKRQHKAQDKALREAAYRERAGMQVLLMQCLCCYPLVIAPTESQHELWCPAHHLFLSQQRVKNEEQERNDGNG